jgi:adenylate cyclase
MGLNLGDVIEEENDVFGDGVNIAARLQAMAEPGAICASAAVVRSLGRRKGLRFERVGRRRGKNMPDAIEVFTIRQQGVRNSLVRAPRAAAAAALVLLAAGSGVAVHDGRPLAYVRDRLGRAAEPFSSRPAVAVLPFDNLSGETEQDYFTDGLTEDIIADLARNRELLVIARNSTFTFKGRSTDVRTVGAQLDADYVVEGSARRSGDQLRVVAQLIDADTGTHLWSRSYDRRIEDVFAVQDDLTTQIVASLVSYVRDSESEAAAARPTDSLRAYDLVLRGRQRYSHGGSDQAALREARDLFERAIELDPGYAVARAHLGLTYIAEHLGRPTGAAATEGLARGLAEVREAIRLEPDLALGYQILSYGLGASGDYESSMWAAERAVELNPSDPDSLMSLAKAEVRFDRAESAVVHAEQARRLHPLAPQYYPYVHGQALYAAGRYADAERVLGDCLVRVPNERNCLRIRTAALVKLDQLSEARAMIARLIELDPAFSIAEERATRRFGDSPLMESYLADLAAAGAPETAGQAQHPPNRPQAA